ncbi:trans-sulfuration enzyme family protein [Variovorax guangxiensis]|uniref:Cystathionine gamma-synthase n=1 Tax=Variovorax guangxiensis TaxID=1775474 RepID=A0A840G7Q5_9BURK|nr:aminotransferase class V-fold PLP-dependent enzyme [Variovorax guangxiensis]MBB4224868.1 cystathionine gamma-synthase [Variovorax guangxiensis]
MTSMHAASEGAKATPQARGGYRLETLAIHAGRSIDKGTGAVAQPIHLSTTFERDVDGDYSRGFMYGRNRNPGRAALEEAVALLDGGAGAAAFSSGVAAASAVFQGLQPGDHVIAPSQGYYGTVNVLDRIFAKWGLERSFVDMTSLDALRASLTPQTRLVWVETPSNPLLQCVDIAGVVEMAHARGIRVVADNTFASPVVQQPLRLGCDMVTYSTTKYLGGHSDVLGGVVISRESDEHFETVRATQVYGGGVLSPFDCWLLLRSLPMLPYRMRGHCANAQRIAEYLAEHARVKAVHYPGLPDHPTHHVAQGQMHGYGGMLSFEVEGGLKEAMALAARLQLFTRATSFGGVESLVEHHASIAGPHRSVPQGLLRLSVGLEHVDDLLADLDQALTTD